jgi:hypothetical protein
MLGAGVEERGGAAAFPASSNGRVTANKKLLQYHVAPKKGKNNVPIQLLFIARNATRDALFVARLPASLAHARV